MNILYMLEHIDGKWRVTLPNKYQREFNNFDAAILFLSVVVRSADSVEKKNRQGAAT